ncbi:MAG: hypothetical protein KKG14_08895 [Alphaproteobacteria bacterium]|nr:hypothetical protein [Alphaproteobacteria bacterium]MBU2271582.1 hypothetical protein [Alphaproteobacteria bacterium]MBU2418803.1 hypothetical protein [Alphaproteobacteria bacterium]
MRLIVVVIALAIALTLLSCGYKAFVDGLSSLADTDFQRRVIAAIIAASFVPIPVSLLMTLFEVFDRRARAGRPDTST